MKLSMLLISLDSLIDAGLPIVEISQKTDNIEIPDNVGMKFLTDLKTKEQAKRDPELFKYFNDQVERDYAQGLDEEMKKSKLDQATIDQIKSAPSMIKKAALFAQKMQTSQDVHYARIEDRLSQKIEETLNAPKVNKELLAQMDQDRQALEEALKWSGRENEDHMIFNMNKPQQ